MCSTDAQADEQCQHGSGRLLAALQCPLEAASPVCATICRMCERSLMNMCCQPIGFWFLIQSSSRSGRSSFERIVAGTAQYQMHGSATKQTVTNVTMPQSQGFMPQSQA